MFASASLPTILDLPKVGQTSSFARAPLVALFRSASCTRVVLASLLLLASACAPKKAQSPPPPPPQPKQNLFVLLPDPEGKPSAISVTNSAGAQTLSQPYQAVRVQRPDTAPSPPLAMDSAEVQRIFGSVIDTLPAAEITFTLYFGEGSDVLLPDSQAQLAVILDAIQERRATAISIIGHTDTTADPQFNYQLGLRRAQGVATILRARGVDDSHLFVDSHGDTDLVVKTARNVAERLNRRVQVIVR